MNGRDWNYEHTGQGRSLRMRAGMPEKEAHADHVGLAYAAGYLDDDEAAARRETIYSARYADELAGAVYDLPSHAALMPPQPALRRERAAALAARLRENHPVALGVIGALAGALLAVVPAVTIAQMFSPGQVIPPGLIAVDAVTVIAGIFALAAGLIYATHNQGGRA